MMSTARNMDMTNHLHVLFDYQRFDGNAALQRVIDSVHARYAGKALSLDEMEQISAAGISHAAPEQKKPEQ